MDERQRLGVIAAPRMGPTGTRPAGTRSPRPPSSWRASIDGPADDCGWASTRPRTCCTASGASIRADILIVCLPATINNDLPATELSIGFDTALNSIVADVDKIKQSAVASLRCFVVEVMGRDCGYLALMSALATGAERVYLPEEGITLDDLTAYVQALTEGIPPGRRLGLVIRSENADPVYTTGFLTSLFGKEGGDLFDAREAILGHIQEGGNPSLFDRIQATRLTARCIDFLSDQLESGTRASVMIGFQSGRLQLTDLTSHPTLVERDAQRPWNSGGWRNGHWHRS